MAPAQRIGILRQHMARNGWDACLIPSSDPHQSEYVTGHWKGREWLSGFTGSAGIVVLTREEAALWTDSRYVLQAKQELEGSGIEMHQQKVPYAPEHLDWLLERLEPGSTLALDGHVFSMSQIRRIRKKLGPQDIVLHAADDPLDAVWTDRPALPDTPVFAFPRRYAGRSRSEKLAEVREKMREKQVDQHLICTLDDIAWLLNVRGSDVECNPVAIGFLLLGTQQATLFMDPVKVPEEIMDALAEDGVQLAPYGALTDRLQSLSPEQSILLDPQRTSLRIWESVPEEVAVVEGETLPIALKAVKNETEIGHLRQAMQKDGVALTKLYCWLEAVLPERSITEYELARQLDRFRQSQGHYYGESFHAIAGYGANGAIVHYRPSATESASIRPEGLLLLDSGGQYLEGTTDITRTIALGPPTEEQKHMFTLVLKGHIALARARFPEGTTGVQLDTLARLPLWMEGCNYGHGTGHGVGFFLNVHEGPQGIAAQPASKAAKPLKAGMLTSNEPGYYQAEAYGIRTENLILCRAAKEEGFLEFETLTLFPIDLQLIEENLLDRTERQWINAYHEKVYGALHPLLNSEEAEWLAQKCAPLA